MNRRTTVLGSAGLVLVTAVLVACTFVALDPDRGGSVSGPTPVAGGSAPPPTAAPVPSSPALTTAPVPATRGGSAPSGPAPALAACPTPTITVRTAAELEAALARVAPGDVIGVMAGQYSGNFVADRSGTAGEPIHLCGEPGAILDAGGIREGYVLHLDGVSHWRVMDLVIRNGQKGLMADATTDSLIQGLTVEDIGDEAIHLRAASSRNTVAGNTIRRTGLRREKFGEGIYVGSATSNWSEHSGGLPDRSDGNVLRDNVISDTTSEAIDVKEGTTGGTIVGNHLDGGGLVAADSLVDVKGNDWVVEGNTVVDASDEGMQTHRIVEGWGMRNVFRRNVIEVRGGGRHVYIHDPDDTMNVVACDNVGEGGAAIRSNVSCTR